MKNFSVSEILILVSCVVCIFFSEYIYLSQKDSLKAIFIGLWPPTILGLLNYINSKRK
jgi:NADH:ubiquinone oxidoreductase subunit 2 (subunit N)